MDAQGANGNTFNYCSYALYATDVKFQPSYRSTGRFSESKHYFSNKHKLYSYKVEASVSVPDRVVFLTNHTPGSASDSTIIASHIDEHKTMLKKSNQELLVDNNGEGSNQYQEYWDLLADKVYQGAASVLRCIHPKKKPRNGELTPDELVRNGNVSSDRVLVENFGRACMLWKIITHSTFKWSESKFGSFTRTCFALTNFHVEVNPLRSDDGRFYKSIVGRYVPIAGRERMRRFATQQRYRSRRVARTTADLNIRTRLSFSSPPQ